MIDKMKYSCFLLLIFAIYSCNRYSEPTKTSSSLPPIFPDYTEVTIPTNICPLNFTIKDCKHIKATLRFASGDIIEAEGNEFLEIDEKEWATNITKNKGKSIEVNVSEWSEKNPDGIIYKPFKIYISTNDINPYIVYRLITPGYEGWNKMGIFQRNLNTFEESTIAENAQNNFGCMNCHSFANYNPQTYSFHSRGANGGTIVCKDGVLEKINIDKIGPQKNGSYNYWHPKGEWIAFSSNVTRQSFYASSQNKIEVYDLSSDLIMYNSQTKEVITDERFNDSLYWETFPCFSPDGKYLYFCSAKAVLMPMEFDKLHYSICKVAFNETDGSFGGIIDTIYSSYTQKGSASLPRISPDGKYLLFTNSTTGTFPIHHKEADLQLIDLTTNQLLPTATKDINSPDVESYHSWSSNGKWIIFSSKRIDTRYTRLFISAWDGQKFSKPFLLPQKDPNSNTRLLYSYNIPEFTNGVVEVDKDKMDKVLNQ